MNNRGEEEAESLIEALDLDVICGVPLMRDDEPCGDTCVRALS